MFKEFREFAVKGNVIDLAVGVIIGAAFGGIVTSLVNDVIMPPVGLLAGGLDFKDLFVALDGKSYATLADATKASAPVIAYGKFINTVVNFLIVAFCIFLLIKQVNRFQKPAPPAPAPGPDPMLVIQEKQLAALERLEAKLGGSIARGA